MRIVYKYEIDSYSVSIKTGADPVVLYAGEQKDSLFLWIEHGTDGSGQVDIHVIGTGYSVPSDSKYLKSVQMESGIVWHIYQKSMEK